MKDYKNLLQQIKKLADAPPPPPAGYSAPAERVPAPTPSAPNAAPSRGFKNPTIAKMQEALVGLAQEVTSQLNLKNLSGPDPRQKQEAGGRDSFADFLTKHFMRNSDVPAVEFSPDPTKTKMEEKDPRAASKLSWVMDTMSRIGHTVSERFIDGVWGPRTFAALDNVYAMASGLFALANAFGVRMRSYTEENLAQLKELVENSKEFSLTQKTEYASTITKHLNAIRRMYQELKNQVLQNPQYQTYIENDTPYLKHDKSQTFIPTPEQLESMKKTFANGFNIYVTTTDKGSRISATLTVDDLSSPEAFNQWLRTHRVAQDAEDVLKQVTDQVGSA